jgi:hypothetical protein
MITEVPQFAGGSAAPQPAATPIRLKQDTGKFRQGTTMAPARSESRRQPEVPSRPELFEPVERAQEKTFPWKLGAIGAIVLVGVIGGAMTLLPSSKPDGNAASRSPVSTPPPAPVVEEAPTTGEISVSTQPAGIRVLLDGKPAGESPTTLKEVAPGRHTVTLLGAAGALKRTVRVEAGKTVTLDLPIFSGFVAISAPILLEVSENGKSLGTTENQIMLSPGHHDLQVANRDLHYSAKQSVDIDSGEVKRLEVDPRGTVNINAQPWAEVWIDGKKIGETPLANLSIPLGVREIVFKHPEFGERKVVTTVVADAPGAVAVDFSKQ